MFLRLENVSKSFGRREALKDVDLHVGEDELLVVLGRDRVARRLQAVATAF